MTPEERIAQLEAQLLDVTARLDQIQRPRTQLLDIPDLDYNPNVPLAQEVSVISETQSAKRTDLVIGFSNPRPDRIDRFELWATNVTGQSKEPYLVASVKDSPAAFSLEADQDTSVSIGIRTITKDGLSSTLGGSPTIGTSIVQQPVTDITIADESIGDAKLDRTTDPIQILNADIVNLQATKITAGTLAAGVILASNISATQINAGTLGAGVILASSIAATQISAGTMSAVNVSGGTFSLTSAPNTMLINGTNGFQQLNTTTGNYIRLVNGDIEARNGSGNLTFRVNTLSNRGEMRVYDNGTIRFAATALSTGGCSVSLRNDTVGGSNVVLQSSQVNLGQTNSGYIGVRNSSAASRVEMGVDANGDGQIQLDGHLSVDEIANTPANPTSSAEMRIYMKGDKFIIQYNDAGTVRYKYLDLTGTGVTWVHTTTAP